MNLVLLFNISSTTPSPPVGFPRRRVSIAMLLCCVVSRDAWSKRYFDSIRREHSILITCQSNARNMKRSGGKICPESKRWCLFPRLPFRLQKLAPAWPDVLNNTSVFARETTLLAPQNFSGTNTDWMYTLYLHTYTHVRYMNARLR